MLVDVSEGALIVTQLLEQYPETYDESDPASYIASTVSVLYYNILDKELSQLGLKLDYQYIENTRPEIAKLLK